MLQDFSPKLSNVIVKLVFAGSLVASPVVAQQIPNMQPTSAGALASALPDAPRSDETQDAIPGEKQQTESSLTASEYNGPIGPVPPLWSKTRLDFADKFRIYSHQAFGPPALVFPALGAGLRMADPPKKYPHDWTDGGGAFGRLYGSALATQTSKRTAAFIADSLFHEDPRYQAAAPGTNGFGRLFHAVGFTFADRSDSGGRTLAVGNFASASAGGFVGMAYLPNGFNDASHAGQRVGTEFLDIAIANIAREFAPEWTPLARKLHLPRVVPTWWTPEHR